MTDGDRSAEVKAMLRVIERETRDSASYTGRGTLRPEVMQAMASVPRHRFVPDHLQEVAYDNGPLPVGHGQTISQPFIVALMTDLLDLQPDDVVLEIGTGCGYQTAVLSRLVKQVESVEIVPELAHSAADRLRRLGIENVSVWPGDGFFGHPERAPYDAIVIAAAATAPPPPLLSQMRTGGRLVLPLGERGLCQELTLIRRTAVGDFETRSVLPVAFVPFTRAADTPKAGSPLFPNGAEGH